MLDHSHVGHVLKFRQDVVAFAIGQEIDILELFVFEENDLVGCGNARPQQWADPREESLLLTNQEVHFLVHVPIDTEADLGLQVERQASDEVRDALDVVDMVELDVFLDLRIQ